jgi:hypothetical protein
MSEVEKADWPPRIALEEAITRYIRATEEGGSPDQADVELDQAVTHLIVAVESAIRAESVGRAAIIRAEAKVEALEKVRELLPVLWTIDNPQDGRWTAMRDAADDARAELERLREK